MKRYTTIIAFLVIVGMFAAQVQAACFGQRIARAARVVTAPVRFIQQRRPVLNALSKLRANTANCSSASASCSGSASVPSEVTYRSESTEVKYVTTANIDQFAAELAANGGLYHDPSYNGRENVYRSSGVATEADAIRAWQRSPGHRANLPYIRNIVCVGGVCVGR